MRTKVKDDYWRNSRQNSEIRELKSLTKSLHPPKQFSQDLLMQSYTVRGLDKGGQEFLLFSLVTQGPLAYPTTLTFVVAVQVCNFLYTFPHI